VQGLNRRQQSLLAAMLRRPASEATVTGHAHSHSVSYLTARKDLQDMEQAGLLQRHRVGNTDRYAMPDGLSRRLLHERPR
jgi:DeoR/GlpR family transcriptional regulator of sugar metabolism